MSRFNFPEKKNYSYSDLKELVYNYKTKHEAGFTHSEILELVDMFPNFTPQEYYNALGVNTCMMIDGETITYHCDVLTALSMCVEGRDMTFYEFD